MDKENVKDICNGISVLAETIANSIDTVKLDLEDIINSLQFAIDDLYAEIENDL